jgi:hypothetical protein
MLPGMFFVFFILFSKAKKADLNHGNQELIYIERTNNFTLFISLFIFYATFFIGLLIFREKSPEGEIPYLKDGTIGMRSWQSRVIVKDINIHYHDSLGRWQKIPDSIVYNKNNWTKTSWSHDKLLKQIEINNKGFFYKRFHPSNIAISDREEDSITDSSFIIQNCVLIFNPKSDIQKTFHDVRFYCTVTFEKINKPIDGLFPGFQLLTFIDTNRVINEKGEKDFSELCLQFNLGMNNNHHPWIPGLDYEPPTKFVSAISAMKRFGNYNDMEIGKEYEISAVIINDKALFLGHTDGTVKLFESQLAKTKYSGTYLYDN